MRRKRTFEGTADTRSDSAVLGQAGVGGRGAAALRVWRDRGHYFGTASSILFTIPSMALFSIQRTTATRWWSGST